MIHRANNAREREREHGRAVKRRNGARVPEHDVERERERERKVNIKGFGAVYGVYDQ